MATLLQINRRWFCRLPDGSLIIDWGAGMAQRLDNGKFFHYERRGEPLGDADLEDLRTSRVVAAFDAVTISFPAWDSEKGCE
jgi:hypothetical protein